VAYEGWVDVLHWGVVGGWARDTTRNDPLVLDVLMNGKLLGQSVAGGYRDELQERTDCDAMRGFWFESKEPLKNLDQIRVRVAGTDHFLPIRPDPISIPDDDLIFAVVGGRNAVPRFLSAGGADRHLIERVICGAGGQIKNGSRILDWGCGCARVARHWVNLIPDVEFHGCDINPDLISWCAKNMPFGSFKTSTVLPRLPYPDNHFDFLYGISVLTHLLFETHFLWAAEIWRVLKPGGFAVLTAQGPSLFPNAVKQIANGLETSVHCVDDGMFIELGRVDGPNQTGNTVTRDVMEKLFHPFELRDYRPCFGLMGIQDTYVFYKNSTAGVQHVSKLLECNMSGSEFEAELEVPIKSLKKCSFLVAAKNLNYPANVEFTLSFPNSSLLPVKSAITRVPEKVGWTGLEAAYRFVVMNDIPQPDGEARLSVKCTGERSSRCDRPLDDTTLFVHNARFLS
jgi:ubiquinone/menaquinone biosynthesis C-methylase UbiE